MSEPGFSDVSKKEQYHQRFLRGKKELAKTKTWKATAQALEDLLALPVGNQEDCTWLTLLFMERLKTGQEISRGAFPDEATVFSPEGYLAMIPREYANLRGGRKNFYRAEGC